jgi:voltage-gated potassium channel
MSAPAQLARAHSGSGAAPGAGPARRSSCLRRRRPGARVLQRVLIALTVLTAVALLVWLDGDGYRDGDERGVGLLDAFYYATVTLSTTGYGDITPVSDGARLVNILVITPLRIAFLIVLVGTTLEVLTQRTREQLRQSRWRSSLRNHTVVVGYGTKGRSAVRALLDDGSDASQIVVVDNDLDHIADASEDGIAAVHGDGTRADVLRRADVEHAVRVIVAVPRDDAAVLVTLTVRRHNTTAYIVAAVRESENAPLLRDGGRNGVVVSSEAAGGCSASPRRARRRAPSSRTCSCPGQGLELAERDVLREEVGLPPRPATTSSSRSSATARRRCSTPSRTSSCGAATASSSSGPHINL